MFPQRMIQSTDNHHQLASEGDGESRGIGGRMRAAHENTGIAVEDEIEGKDFFPPSSTRSARSANPIVYLEYTTLGHFLGRITLELRSDIVPATSENFRQLCTGERNVSKATGNVLRYKGGKLHRIVSDKYIVGGDLSKLSDGTFSECAFGTHSGFFPDENMILRHTGPGCLAMMNRGPNSNGSQFYITTSEVEEFDGKCVVFGCVVDEESLETLKKLERLGTEWGGTKRVVVCSDSGQVNF